MRTFDRKLDIWDTAKDRRLKQVAVGSVTQVLPFGRGCATLGSAGVWVHQRTGAPRLIRGKAGAIGRAGDTLLVSVGRKVIVYGSDGSKRREYPSDVGVTALARTRDWLVLGFRDGNMELTPTRHSQEKPTFSFEDVPSSPVVRLLPGPAGTVIAGFADGTLGLWSVRNGTRLRHDRLHGPVTHLLLRKNRLLAGSELGQFLVWDLSVFYSDYCSLMRLVWSQVPIVWEKGLPVRRKPPRNHRCAR
jgi:hypothetical protein